MGICIARVAFGAWCGAFACFVALDVAGMDDAANLACALMFLANGVQLGALVYESRNGGSDV